MKIHDCLKLLHKANARIAVAIGDGVPKWSPAIKEQADHALLGDVYRAPNGEWTQIDFERIDWNGTRSVNPGYLIMALRRFAVLRPLSSAYRATGDERYAQAARRYIEAFLRDHPPSLEWEPVPGDGATQYDNRVVAWLTSLSTFETSPAFDDDLVSQMFLALRGNLRYLAGHVWPDRNIRFLHGEVLLLSGVRLSWMPEAAEWQRHGLEILNDGVRRQVLPDGAHMEATPGYHGYVLQQVDRLWRLARAMPEMGLLVPTERVAAMYDYRVSTTRPDGALISLHDTRYVAAVIKPTTTHIEPRAIFRKKAGLPPAMPPEHAFFPDAGQVFIRDGWTPESSCLSFDAAARRSYHWHPCRNSITLYAHGRALLVDPGYTFETAASPRYGHRTAHHNTVSFNGWDQSDSPANLWFRSRKGYALAQGVYGGGYWPLQEGSHGTGLFGEHTRTLLWVSQRFAVVLDAVRHTAVTGRKPDIETCWQLSEGPAECDQDARRVITRHPFGNLRLDFPITLAGSQLTLHEGEHEPRRGWLPLDWGSTCIPAPLIRMTAAAYDPWHGDMATVLTPFAGKDAPQITVSGCAPELVRDARSAGYICVEQPDGGRDVVVWTRNLGHAIERQHGVHSDASLVHLRLAADGVVQDGLMIDGTTCTFENNDVTEKLQ